MTLHVGKTIIVTGGAGAIGLATAKILAAEAAQVVLVDINGEGLDKAGAELRKRDVAVETICADCSQEEAVKHLHSFPTRRSSDLDRKSVV